MTVLCTNGCFHCRKDSFVRPELFLIICQSYAFLFQEQEADLIPQRVRKQSGTDWLKSRGFALQTYKTLAEDTSADTHGDSRGFQRKREDNRRMFSAVTKLTYTESSLSHFTVFQCVFWQHTEHMYNIQSPSSRFKRDEKNLCPGEKSFSTLCASLYQCQEKRGNNRKEPQESQSIILGQVGRFAVLLHPLNRVKAHRWYCCCAIFSLHTRHFHWSQFQGFQHYQKSIAAGAPREPFNFSATSKQWWRKERYKQKYTLMRKNRFVWKRQKVQLLFIPKPLNPLLNTQVLCTSVGPNAAANKQPAHRRSEGSTLQGGSCRVRPHIQPCLGWREAQEWDGGFSTGLY